MTDEQLGLIGVPVLYGGITTRYFQRPLVSFVLDRVIVTTGEEVEALDEIKVDIPDEESRIVSAFVLK